MKERAKQGLSGDELASYEQQCAALARDWQRLGTLIAGYRAPGADRRQLEGEYLGIRSTLSCDYPILTYWRKGGYGLTAGINRLMASSPSLGALAESGNAADKNWRAVWDSLQRVGAALSAARGALAAGKDAVLPTELLRHDTHVPFPIKKILKYAGTATAIVLLAATLYVMRHFLGFWAPGAGEGIVVTEGMSDEEQIRAILSTMSRAFQDNDVDLFMTLIADDFQDEQGRGKRALRAVLQAYKETGDFGTVSMDWSRMHISDRSGLLDVRPVFLNSATDRLTLYLGFKPYGGKLLIATGNET